MPTPMPHAGTTHTCIVVPIPTPHPHHWPVCYPLLSPIPTAKSRQNGKMEKPMHSKLLAGIIYRSLFSTSPDTKQPCCLGCSLPLQNQPRHHFALDDTLDPSYACHLGQPAQVHHTLPAVPPPPAGAAQPPPANPAWTQTPCPCFCWCCCHFLGGSWVQWGCCWPGSQNLGGLAAVWHAIDGDKCSRVLLLLRSE